MIEKIEDVGIRINGITFHCYNEQNGYYDDELELKIDIEIDEVLKQTHCFSIPKEDDID